MNSTKLNKVYLSIDVYAVCLQHALSTEKEEIMGLLIGDVDEIEGISHISSCLILRRSDKQADRVEISPEQLMAATTYAEDLSVNLRMRRRVVGWYHSHPHITVWPSRVDVNTQALYQKMDSFFVGLIFSVFPNETRNNGNYNAKSDEIQMTAFQSHNTERREIPIILEDSKFNSYNLEMMAKLPKILCEEEEEIAPEFLWEPKIDPLILYHNRAHKFIGLVNIMEKVTRPIYEIMNARESILQQKITILKKEMDALTKELKDLTANNKT